MSEYPNFPTNPFEVGGDKSPNKDPAKKKRGSESKPSVPEKAPASDNQAEKKTFPSLDKLFERTEDKKGDTDGKETSAETLSIKPELTSDEATEALGRMADARELEVGAAELNGAEDDAAETAEAVAAVELLQHVKEEAMNEERSVEAALRAAEERTIVALGLTETGSPEPVEQSLPTATETVLPTNEAGEAEIAFFERETTEQDAEKKPNTVGHTPAEKDADASARTEYVYYESNAAGAMLLGGIIGYLVGKRRGRIKTEKRLAPVQKKLEREVRDIHEQLIDSEMRIRRMAAEKVRMVHHIERPNRGSLPPERVQSARAESRLNLQKPAPAERLGKVLVRAEAARPSETNPKLRDITPERVRTMPRRELLKVAEKIIVEGSSLRQVYESHLVGERGLRRLITEHLRGKDIRKSLRREMVEREIDFERDPILRDKAYQEAHASTESRSLQQLLQDAGVAPGSENDSLPTAEQQARYEKALRKAVQRRRMADTAMVTVIVVLAVLVAILLIQR